MRTSTRMNGSEGPQSPPRGVAIIAALIVLLFALLATALDTDGIDRSPFSHSDGILEAQQPG